MQTLIWDNVGTGVLLSDFPQLFRCKNADVLDISFTLLDAAVKPQLRFSTKMPQPKGEEAGSLSKSERQKLQWLYTQGGGAYGSVRNLAKTSNVPVSKVRQLLHSKTSDTKFTSATREFKRMQVFAKFKNEIWCMDIANVDKLAKVTNGVMYLLVREDVFDRT